MSIRKRLASFIILMTGLLVIIGGLLLLGGPIMLGAFKQSINSMDSLNTIREVRSGVLLQRAALNRYFLVGEQQELLTSEESATHVQQAFLKYKEKSDKRLPDWYLPLESLWSQANKEANQVINLFRKGQKSQAYDQAFASLLPKYQELVSHLDELEKEKSEEAHGMFDISRELSEKAGIVVLGVIGFALLFGFVLFRSLYRSVMTPLELLKKGASEFGKGQWDHKIEMSSSNEFGALAKSFNTMADNVKQLQQQAIHMDRMSAVGQLAGGVAHEINNPLTGVLGQAQILLAKTDETSREYAQLKKIEQAALRCKKIVRGLLDFSRPSQRKFELINVNDVIGATLDLCEADIKRSRVVTNRKFYPRLPKVEGNESELQQILLNLTNNALQAMPNGGTLTIETLTHNNAHGSGSTKKTGPWVEIIVKDSGVGISQEHINKVFEPFFTTKDIGKGTGLGLSVSMGIVEKHGGIMHVESGGVNRGASFHLLLPVGKAKQLREAA